MSRRSTPPKYARHSSGQARVRIRGQVHYLGEYGTPESKLRYRTLIAEYLDEPVALDDATISIGQLALRYREHAEAYYVKNGTVTDHIHTVRAGLRLLVEVLHEELAREFSPRKLKALRQRLIDRRLSRKYINDVIAAIKRAFKWAVSEEIIGQRLPRAADGGRTEEGSLRGSRNSPAVAGFRR
jgi:hypothetical protein